MFWLDVKYLKLISSRLEGFVIKKEGNEFLADCRCPYCGDSLKNKRKKRGYFFRKQENMFFKCHNCGIFLPFGAVLNIIDPSLYSQYSFEQFKDKATKGKIETSPVIDMAAITQSKKNGSSSILDELKAVSTLGKTHIAYKYLKSRKIPEKFFNDLYFAEDFYGWTKGHTDKYLKSDKIFSRIVIPWFTKRKYLYKYHARSLDDTDSPKYISIVTDNSIVLPYGMDRLLTNHKVYVLEGPFDSMFLPNAIAVGTSSIYKAYSAILNQTFIPDNQPRNNEVVKIFEKIIGKNYNIFIPPPWWNYKDINMAVEQGVAIEDLPMIIDSNTFSGIEATVRFNQWKKI